MAAPSLIPPSIFMPMVAVERITVPNAVLDRTNRTAWSLQMLGTHVDPTSAMRSFVAFDPLPKGSSMRLDFHTLSRILCPRALGPTTQREGRGSRGVLRGRGGASESESPPR
eukprot:8355665-Pyramimonas_sp.AAC.1